MIRIPLISALILVLIAPGLFACDVDINHVVMNTSVAFSLDVPLETDESIESVSWSFGDGTTSSHPAPTHPFAQTGTYECCVEVVKGRPDGWTCQASRCVQVIVDGSYPCQLSPSFLAEETGPGQLAFALTDGAGFFTTAESVSWDFGDGSVNLGAEYASHTYDSAGWKTVCASVTATSYLNTCSDVFCAEVEVPEYECLVKADFEATGNLCSIEAISTSNTIGNTAITSLAWTVNETAVGSDPQLNWYARRPASVEVCLHVVAQTGDYQCAAEACHWVNPNCLDDLPVGLAAEATGSADAAPSQALVTLFPNPAQGLVRIETESSNPLVTIRSVNRKVVARGNLTTVDTSAWPTGIYFVEVETQDGRSINKLFVE